jgi:transcription antitermination factor NusG
MTIDTTRPNWYVLYTLPHHEAKAKRDLEQQDITAFLPMRKEIRFWSDRKKSMMVPMFSTYLFVNIGRKERAQALKPAGVIRFLDSNANPSIVADDDINLIKKIMDGNVSSTIERDIMPGDEVVITSGPLNGLRGPLVSRKGGDRMLLDVKSINKQLLVDISGYCIEKIKSPNTRTKILEG